MASCCDKELLSVGAQVKKSLGEKQKEWIIDAIHERLYPLPGHQVTTNQKISELIKRNQLGI